MLKVLLPMLCLSLYHSSQAQHIFAQKLEACNVSEFCLDCGEPKATYDSESFKELSEKINSKFNLKGGKGRSDFQVLVDSLGNGCVLSHTDQSSNQLTREIVSLLNSCKWFPAKEQDKAVTSSITVSFRISNDRLEGRIQRIDLDDFTSNMKNPGTPEIYNKTYHYENSSLKNYEISVWQKANSMIPGDMGRLLIVDKDDIVWAATYNGVAKFDGNQFTRLNETNSPFKKDESLEAIAVDSRNVKWVYSGKAIYKYDNVKWDKIDVKEIESKATNSIVCQENDQILFSSENGIIIDNNSKRVVINQSNTAGLPSNDIDYAYRDKKGRLWIGTFDGSIMIDSKNNITEFNKTNSPINKTCITRAAEDNDGNIYFSLYAYEKSKERNKDKEGIAVLTKDGKWLHFNHLNSGLPANHVNSLLFDKFENVLWIGTNEAGLVRFDLKTSWENYHNLNSAVPSSYIFDLVQDSKGSIYACTFYGLMRLKKK